MLRKVWNFIKQAFTAILLVLILIVLVFLIPQVQTFYGKKLTNAFNDSFETKLEVRALQINYKGDIVLNDVFLEDDYQDTIIYAKTLSTSLINLVGFSNNQVHFSNTEFEELTFKLKQYSNEDSDEFSKFIEKLSDTTSSNKPPFQLKINRVLAFNSEFIIENENISDTPTFYIKDLDFNLTSFNLKGPDLDLNLRRLSGVLKQGIVVEDFNTQFSYTTKAMKFKELSIETPYSFIEGQLQFNYQREDLQYFYDKVNLEANFLPSTLSTTDLKRFYEGFGYGHELSFTGQATGQLNNLNFESLNINGLTNTSISGNLNLTNSFGDGPFHLDSRSVKLSSSYDDLIRLLPDDLEGQLPAYLKDFEYTTLDGKLYLSKDELNTNVLMESKLGRASINLDFTEYQNPVTATYEGVVNVRNFDFGPLFKNPSIGKASFDFEVDGAGFTKESLNTLAEGNIQALEINDYTFRGIDVNGNLKAPYFDGSLKSSDPNFQFQFNGLLDASGVENTFDFDAKVNYSNLYALNIVKNDTLADFKGDLKVNLKGNSIDDLKGSLIFNNFEYENSDEKFKFEQLKINSFFDDNLQTISIDSPDVISGNIEGEFRLSKLPQLFANAIENLYFKEKESTKQDNQFVDFDFNIYNKIAEVFLPNIEVASNTYVRGSIDASENDFSLNFKSPLITINDKTFERINVQVDNKNPLYNTYVEIENILTSFYDVHDFNLINVNLKDTLFVRTEFKGGSLQQDNFNLSLYQTISSDDKSTFGFKRSNITFNDKLWFINKTKNKKNKVEIERGFQNFNIDSIQLSSGKQSILLNGVFNDSTFKDINLNLSNVELADVIPKQDSINFAGRLDGNLDIYQEEGIYSPNLDVSIEDFTFNDIVYGQFSLVADGNKDLSSFNVKSVLDLENQTLFKADGSIFTKDDKQYFDIDVFMNRFNIKSFSGFGKDVLSHIRGFASGQVNVGGELTAPNFNGELRLNKAGLKIPYLNIDFDFNENARLGFDGSNFIFDDIELTDTKYDTQGVLNGRITNRAFKDWFLDLSISSNNLVALDTQFKEGDLYYGTAFINGNASLTGPIDEIEINVQAETQKNTVFKIPLDDSESLGDNSFIYFLSLDDKLSKEAGRKIELKEVKGLSLNFDLDITRDAEVEIVVDPVNGSSLKGRGAGTLLIEINTNGKFNMYGDFVAYEGEYNFKYSGLVQKRFEVVPGSNLTWNGDPVRANIDLQAKYITEANPAVLLENPTINREIPVEVIISLGGQIIQPDIDFSLNYPNLSSVVKSELDYRVQGRENTELQALSLVTQGTFYSQAGLGQNAITGNLIERASGLVDDIISEEDNKFKLGLNYQQNDRSLNQNNLADRVGLSIKTNISDRVLISGRFGVPVGGVTESVVFGDVEVNFLLNETGSLRANVFNRESDIQFIGEELGYTQGIGLSYTVDFNTFEELIKKIMNKEYVEEKKEDNKSKNEKSLKVPTYIKFPSDKPTNR